MKRNTRLYNILFPSWMFFLLPTPVMLLLAAGNFGIDSLVTLLGLFLAFYVQPARVWAIQSEDGLWTLRGESRKGGAIFRDRFLDAAKRDPVKGDDGHAAS